MIRKKQLWAIAVFYSVLSWVFIENPGAKETAPQPKMVVDSILYNCGEVMRDETYFKIKKGEPWSQEFTVVSSEGKPFKITKVDSSSKFFSVTYDTDNGREYNVKVTVSPDLPIGQRK